MSSVNIEFSPTYFRSIFGDDAMEWQSFIEVNVRTFSQGLERLRQATDALDMETVSEVRHAMGPSLKQWGTISLEAQLMGLDSGNLVEQWPGIEGALRDLISALEKLS